MRRIFTPRDHCNTTWSQERSPLVGPHTDTNSEKTVRLPKHQETYLADKLDSLEKWHEFYDPIARCRGVKTYMLNR